MADQTGGDTEIMTTVINATDQCHSAMLALDKRVQGVGTDMRIYNQSDAGFMLSDAVGDWNQRFNPILLLLEDLNRRAIDTRNQLIATSEEGTAIAGS